MKFRERFVVRCSKEVRTSEEFKQEIQYFEMVCHREQYLSFLLPENLHEKRINVFIIVTKDIPRIRYFDND